MVKIKESERIVEQRDRILIAEVANARILGRD
jgi:hypothetical protein